jgi:hypothetical protein
MTLRGTFLIPAIATALLLPACGSDTAETPQLTQQQREDQFWTAYEQRMGLVGTDYASPTNAKYGAIRYGQFLCGELANGTDRDVLIAKGSKGNYSKEEMTVQVDTSVEFLCPHLG